ncbi:MAG: DUF4394 domain-containing protein [Verrucomicrobiota bacterium]|nr:DUF4394 domain-containing protein [Verrucomicrobiota bacterium]
MTATKRVLSLLTIALLVAITGPARAALVYATSGTNIASFDNSTPGVVSSVPVTGLQTGESLVGLDVRPANQLLYALGSSNRLYTINPTTGVATLVPQGATPFTLNGTSFGVDFNPVVDRIRVVSNTGQNIRINPNDATLAGTDTAINGATTSVVAAAYTNSFVGAASTTLYAIDAAAGTLVTIGSINGTPNSPNGGVTTLVGSLGLGTGLDPRIGFDITGLANLAYATILTGGTDKLYQINLSTGTATLVGTVGNGTTVYNGMTFATAVPEPSTYALLATTAVLFGAVAWRRRQTA